MCAVPPLFRPPGMGTNDNWFAKAGDTYHAFYLQAPSCLKTWEQRATWQHVGHATSRDLVHWTDHGPVLVALKGTWNDGSIATGSVVKHDGRWYLVYTGHGRQAGIGLAVSNDLYTWEKIGDGPVAPLGQRLPATWAGKAVEWVGLADPYVLPEPVDGWWQMVINSQIVGEPISTAGCLTTMRSRDLRHWEPGVVLTWPRFGERLETPQVWSRNGRWYCYYGVAHDHGVPPEWIAISPEPEKKYTRINCVVVADRFEGPYRAGQDWVMRLPDGRGGYIHKVLAGPDGQDVLLTSMDWAISRAYPVTYAADGAVIIGQPAVPAP